MTDQSENTTTSTEEWWMTTPEAKHLLEEHALAGWDEEELQKDWEAYQEWGQSIGQQTTDSDELKEDWRAHLEDAHDDTHMEYH